MKKDLQNFKKLSFLIVFMFMLASNLVVAQSRVVVEPGFNTLPDAVAAAAAGDTLVLQRGADYVIDQAIAVTIPIVIVGEDSPEEDPPAVLSLFADPGEAGSQNMMEVSADLSVHGIGIQGMTIDGQQARSFMVVLAEDLNITIEGCVYQSVRFQLWTSNGINLVQENNIYFNQGGPSWDNGQGYGPLFGSVGCNVVSRNNTFFVGGRIFGNANASGGGQYMDHNSYIATWGDQFFPVSDNDFELKNCILYDAEVRGFVGFRGTPGVDTIWPGDFRDWAFPVTPAEGEVRDSMSGNWCVYPLAADSSGGARNVNVHNNIQMMSPFVQAFHQANGVTPMTFTATSVPGLADEFGWTIEPNWLQEDGTEIDPGITVDEGAYATSFAQRIGRMDTEIDNVAIVWRPGGEIDGQWIWPLPFDLKPSNTEIYTLGDDGYPLGDLNWFGQEVVDAWKAGEPNPLGTVSAKQYESFDFQMLNYPDPFTSSTRIKYDLPKSGKVSLKVYNVAGAEVATLVNGNQIAGPHDLEFNSADLSSGLYFCKIVADNLTQVHKMSVVK